MATAEHLVRRTLELLGENGENYVNQGSSEDGYGRVGADRYSVVGAVYAAANEEETPDFAIVGNVMDLFDRASMTLNYRLNRPSFADFDAQATPEEAIAVVRYAVQRFQ